MNKEYITLSQKEVRRLKILHKVMEGEVTQVKAAEILGISDRADTKHHRKAQGGG